MPASFRWVKGDVEVTLAEVIGSDLWLLEIVTPVYPTFSHARTELARNAQDARYKIFGYVDVTDLSSVPVDDVSPESLVRYANGRVIFYEKYDADKRRNSYQYFGRPKEGFDPGDMRWGGQLAIDAPKKEIAKTTFTCDGCGETFEKIWSDEDALQEMIKIHGMHVGPVVTLCDDCYDKATMADAENLEEIEDERTGQQVRELRTRPVLPLDADD